MRESDDHPLAVCRGLRIAAYGRAVTEEELAEERELLSGEERAELDGLPTERPTRRGNDDALGWRVGPAEYDYLHRHDSPDNERDTMG